MMTKIKSKKYLIISGIVIILAVGGFFVFKNGNGKQTVSVVRADIAQEVVATGKVKPSQNVDLGFDRSGRISQVNTFVGDEVSQGKILVTLEFDGVTADLDKARAALKEEEIKLREIKNTSPANYADAEKNLEAVIRESFASADNAVRNRADQFFKNIPDNPFFEISITSGNFVHYFNVPNDLRIDLNSRRKNIEVILNNWQSRISKLNSALLLEEADQNISNLNTISVFLDKMASAVNSFTSVDYTYDTSVSSYKTTISSARSDVSSAISSLVTAKDKFNAAPTLSEGGQFEDVLVQESKVAQAKANVDSLIASLDKSIIKAPFSGVVTVQDAKIGSVVSSGQKLVGMTSKQDSYIEANISEVNIDKISVGNPVSIKFDAFPNEELRGFVSFIEPGDVIIDGVVNYKIRADFGSIEIAENGQEIWRLDNSNQKIKNGLTANLKVMTAQKAKVLSLPLYAIIKEGDKTFVNKLVGKNVQKTPVNLGISGSDGMVEVINGLNEGDIVEF